MPELPEVETTRRGIEPHCLDRRIVRAQVHDPRLRWPVRGDLTEWLKDRRITDVSRRAKYLLIAFENGERLLIHLGMSGSLRLVEPGTPKRKHDHVEIEFDSGRILRYHDPRRFGALLTDHVDNPHERLANLGPEPLGPDFTPEYLHRKLQNRLVAIKPLIMSADIVVGAGNIYANEALFLAGIHPTTSASRCDRDAVTRLVAAIRDVLARAIEQGGTTLRDFVREDGQPGYFKQTLNVYDRADQPCRVCSTPIRKFTQAQRATYCCPVCQPPPSPD
ncbi:DNA-formamidopyrimidine glycosylase [Halothiobacillus diazotrophicus]|uniref:Formamidopyrimidine-DNA glycosylase n=1 Tax=Halothiobacillus diazotrophicus TaxID=1860122 RepID=A0A191ZJ10_9GAMM|nr:bifunctional DNA-formamidopyrimidine glycosylase/DNA-(apurinic or apyrimidinic site) lyase [Halothiobacillus diazotrophicus]ANJ67828.1 DNA-formamidopyrimidine glycosylase [Halothiobacillus diazotrophicus]